jgi:drug/metabolite transporter (DMT)-like permease
MLTGSSLIMLPLVWSVEGAPDLALSPTTWIAVGYYAAVATALAYLLYYRVLAQAGSGNVMLVTLLIPPVAITLGALVRDENLAPSAYAGFALLAAGLMVLGSRPKPQPKRV